VRALFSIEAPPYQELLALWPIPSRAQNKGSRIPRCICYCPRRPLAPTRFTQPRCCLPPSTRVLLHSKWMLTQTTFILLVLVRLLATPSLGLMCVCVCGSVCREVELMPLHSHVCQNSDYKDKHPYRCRLHLLKPWLFHTRHMMVSFLAHFHHFLTDTCVDCITQRLFHSWVTCYIYARIHFLSRNNHTSLSLSLSLFLFLCTLAQLWQKFRKSALWWWFPSLNLAASWFWESLQDQMLWGASTRLDESYQKSALHVYIKFF